jgi:hypothetical protein
MGPTSSILFSARSWGEILEVELSLKVMGLSLIKMLASSSGFSPIRVTKSQ